MRLSCTYFFIYIYKYSISYTKFHNKTAPILLISAVSEQLISTFIFFLLKVEFNFSVQRVFM